ncbi:MAG TPA: septum formation initiator family protein [Brevundimonas sp.]|uniref:FtsB family cell division protein n=1 Tax=Brevundimonas sp. TaxID=1871086 RepID=UPI002DEFB2FE|nr:septum formation initiator family protein [Brevundimonas sp.]
MLDRMKPYRVTVALFLAVVYLSIQALTGQLGLLSAHARAEALQAREAEALRLERERADLEMRVRHLGDDNLSRDLLEERARALLGYSDPRDVVVEVQAPATPRNERRAAA